jgi:hypothetical protein
MSVDAAAASDRLPWLDDEPTPQRVRQRRGTLLPWAAAAVVVVAAGGYWIGTRSVHEAEGVSQRPQASTTVRLPPPQPAPQPQIRIAPQPEVRPSVVPEVRPAPVREVRITPPPAQRLVEREPAKAQASTENPLSGAAADVQKSEPPVKVAAPPAPPVALPRPWDPHLIAGAAGRVVQIGAFGSVPQAKRGWWFMVRTYPAMAHLPALVRPDRNSKGRTFYRFRVGTTSQAHSEVLCQRMQKIGFSCAIAGLPWKAKVER